MPETKTIHNLEHWCKILNENCNTTHFYSRQNHLIIFLPAANQDVSSKKLTWILNITKKWPEYIFICCDDNIINAGEIALELCPGVHWFELFEQMNKSYGV